MYKQHKLSQTIFMALLILSFILTGCQTATPAATQPPAQQPAQPTDTQPPAATTAPAQAVSSGEQVTLNVAAISFVAAEAWRKVAENFEAKYPNIKINLIELPWETIQEQQYVDLAGQGSYDTVMVNVAYGPQYISEGLLEPLDSYINSTSKSDFDLTDFPKSLLDTVNYKGKIYGVPMDVFPQQLYYREDLLQKYNIPVPQTLDELLAAAEKLTLDTDGDGKPDIYGTVLQGMPISGGGGVVWHWYPYLFSYGGRVFDENNNPVINSPEAVKALEFYKELFKYSPPESVNYGCDQSLEPFSGGRIGIATSDSDIWPVLINAPVHIKTAPFPKGPVGKAILWPGNFSVSISAKSAHKQEAWLWTAYATYNDEAMDVYGELGFIPGRASAMERIGKTNPVFANALAGLHEAVSPPMLTYYSQVEDILAKKISAVLLDQLTPQQALDEAQSEIQELVNKNQ